MRTYRLEPVDARGKRIRKGSRVRVVGIPDLSSMRGAKDGLGTQRVFRHLRGQCKVVSGCGRYGHVEIIFQIRTGPVAGMHIVEIEPNLLIVQKLRRSS